MSNQLYPSDMADREWEYIKGMIPAAKPGGRKRQTDMRLSLNAIFYLIRTGYQWRHLPREYPPRETVQGYFRTWRIAGVWERIHYQCATLYESRKGMSRDINPMLTVQNLEGAARMACRICELCHRHCVIIPQA